MTNALCLQVAGPDADIALAGLESLLADLGIGLRELQSTTRRKRLERMLHCFVLSGRANEHSEI